MNWSFRNSAAIEIYENWRGGAITTTVGEAWDDGYSGKTDIGRVMRGLPAEAAFEAGVTTLDRVHAAMLLQAGGQANALRALIKSEQDRGTDFLRLANALSALYPTGSEEKRLFDAMLLAVPG